MPKVDESANAQQTRDEMKAIGNVLTWLLGFLALIIAGMVSFIFQGLNPLVAEYNFLSLKFAVVSLLALYLFTAISTLHGLGISFIDSYYTNTAEELEKNFKKLKSILKFDINMTIFSLFTILGFVIYFVHASGGFFYI